MPAPLPATADRDLTALAFATLTERLDAYGSVLAPKHQQALYLVLDSFTRLANGDREGRWGYPLPCGAGKTEAAKAWCWALWTLGKPYSVAISASKVEALCELKRGLIKLGVPEDAIGLVHSYAHLPGVAGQQPEGTASLPATEDNDHRQIVLLTHNKLRSQREGDRMPTFKGQLRSLLIYDESLLISDTWTLSMVELDQGVGWLRAKVKREDGVADELVEAFDYGERCLNLLDEELKAQKRHWRPRPVTLPEFNDGDRERIIAALKHPSVAPLKQLIKASPSPFRVLSTSGGGVCWYDLAIPHDLSPVCVLDASLVIRHLPKIGDRIQMDPGFDGDIKGYGRVEVRQMLWNSGRQSMEDAFPAKREDRLVSQEVAAVVREIPADQGVIIWSFKPKVKAGRSGVDILAMIRSDLEASGIDVDATVTTADGPKPRFVFLTWGNETSTNDYAYCSNVIMAGVLHRSDRDLAAAIIGQKTDLTADYSELADIQRSEVGHVVYQALSRGSCRVTEDGEARGMKAWIIHRDPGLETTIRTAMPGIVWSRWQPQFIKTEGRNKIQDLADKALQFLEGRTERISTQALKKALGWSEVPARTFTAAIRRIDETSDRWALEGRSLAPRIMRKVPYKEERPQGIALNSIQSGFA